MNDQQKKAARAAIRRWANGDPEPGGSQNPLADRHRFTEQAGPDRGGYTVRATQTRQSGGSKPVTYAMNSFELVRMKRIIELIEDQDRNLIPILYEWGQGATFQEIADKREYSKSVAHERFNLGMNLVFAYLNASDQGFLFLSGLKVQNKL